MEATPKRLALVTGGASGLGRATVERLARDGLAVILADRQGELAEREAQGLRAAGLDVQARAIDLADEAATRALVRALPPLDVLVNNAGVFSERSFAAVSSEDFLHMFQINLLAVATLTQEVAPRMGRDARIVNIASRAALGEKHFVHYATSKAALVGYTRSSAMALAPRGILVNAIAPGLIETPLSRTLSPERWAAQLASQPTGEAGQPDDIAQAVAFFASPLTRFVTGQVLFVDGGKSLGGTLT